MKTVLNKINVDTTQQPLFLGEDLALQRYDKHKYPVFFDLFKKQLEQMWRPEEISLLNDRASYQMLSDAEKFIFTSNLKFQTMLDSVIARGIPTLQKYISNPELEACFNTWQLFETIHSYSYTYIIKNVYADPGIVFDNILTDKEIIKRAYSVCNEYDKLIDFTGDDIKKQIYLTLMSINILEGVRFYVSFVCSFAFGHNGKMVGNADIIKLIRRDEACVDKDTQILTEHGWINLPDLKDGVKVAQYHKDGTIDFVVPSHIVRKPYKGDMISLKNQTGHIDMLLTPDHRVVYHKDGVIEEELAINFTPSTNKKIPIFQNISIDSIEHYYQYDQELIKDSIDYNDMVYCVTVPSGMFIAKRNDGIFVTGNCHMSITQNLIKILQDEKSEGFKETAKDCKDIAIEMFRAAAQEEKEWANYIFQHGSILGINAEIITQYIEWLTDTRMANLRLPKIFNTKNPIGGWIEPWMQSESVQVAPQEHELTSYKISASVSDIEDMDFSNI